MFMFLYKEIQIPMSIVQTEGFVFTRVVASNCVVLVYI